MNVERDVLASACDSREAYSRIVKYLGTDDLTDTGRMVWDVIEEYYGRDVSAGYVKMDTLQDLVAASVTNPKHKETLSVVVQGIASTDVSGVNVVAALIAMKREIVGAKLASGLLSNDDVSDLLHEYEQLTEADTLDEEGEDEVPIAGWDPTVLDDEDEGDLIKVAPASLNERLAGGCYRGHHIILFARPEMGKTSMLANMAAGFLMQDLKVLYLGNEDPIKDIRIKFLSRIIEWPKEQVIMDTRGAYDVATNTTNYENLYTMQISPGTPWEIEQLVKMVQPDVLMIDQLRNVNVKSGQSDGMVQHLEAAAKAIRQIGIRNDALVVSVTQAGDSASGKAVLEMSDCDSSKTGIPAQADVMIGLGASREDEAAMRRVISLPKNKRSGRHEFFPIKADFALSKFTSMG
jgi:archaellum biogenesis ATPase FlaH